MEAADNTFVSDEEQRYLDQNVELDNENIAEIDSDNNDTNDDSEPSSVIEIQPLRNDTKLQVQIPSSSISTSDRISEENANVNANEYEDKSEDSISSSSPIPLPAVYPSPVSTANSNASSGIGLSHDSSSGIDVSSESSPSFRRRGAFPTSFSFPNIDGLERNPPAYSDAGNVKDTVDLLMSSDSENGLPPYEGMDTHLMDRERPIRLIRRPSETIETTNTTENEQNEPERPVHIYPVVTIIRKKAPPKPPRRKGVAKLNQNEMEVQQTEGTSKGTADKKKKNTEIEFAMSGNNSQDKEMSTSSSSTSGTEDDLNEPTVPKKMRNKKGRSFNSINEYYTEEKISYTDEHIPNKDSIMRLLGVNTEFFRVNEGELSICTEKQFLLKTTNDASRIIRDYSMSRQAYFNEMLLHKRCLRENYLNTGLLNDGITNKGTIIGTFNRLHLTSDDVVYDLYITPQMDYITMADIYYINALDVTKYILNANYCLMNPIGLSDFLNRSEKNIKEKKIFKRIYKHAMKKSLLCFIDAMLHYSVEEIESYDEQIAFLKRGVYALIEKLLKKDKELLIEVFKKYMKNIDPNIAIAKKNINLSHRINSIFVDPYIRQACEIFEYMSNYHESLATVTKMFEKQKRIMDGCFQNVYFYQNAVNKMVTFLKKLKGHIQRNSILKKFHFDYLLENSKALAKMSYKNLTSASVDEKYKDISVLQFGLHMVRHFSLGQVVHDFFETKKVEVGAIATRTKAFIFHIQKKYKSEKEKKRMSRSLNQVLKKETYKLRKIFDKMRKQYISLLKIRYALYTKRNLLFDSFF